MAEHAEHTYFRTLSALRNKSLESPNSLFIIQASLSPQCVEDTLDPASVRGKGGKDSLLLTHPWLRRRVLHR